MADSMAPHREIAEARWGKKWMELLGTCLSRGGWRVIDPVYIWSAAIGVLLGLVLIAAALLMQAARLR
jgi:hypothetical protein